VYLLVEFRDQPRLEDAILKLKADGIAPSQMDLFSEEPVEFRRGILDRPSHMSLAAVLGAIVTGGSATSAVYWAQHNYTLVSGGMPVFSFWGTGVITYETTMLGAVLAIFGWFLWESGLIRKRDKTAPTPVVAPGAICLRVRCGDDQAERAMQLLDGAGAQEIEKRN
jgi:Protein of unknown function (DUF3341)